MTMPEISLTATDPVTGREETVEVHPADLVSVIMPFQPATINPEFFQGLPAKKWRHQETNWYDGEHELLTRILRRHPNLDSFIAEMRLLLSAVFVKHAEEWQRPRLHRQSRKDFDKKYTDFIKKWKRHPQLMQSITGRASECPDDYLRQVYSGTYFRLRNLTLSPLALENGQS